MNPQQEPKRKYGGLNNYKTVGPSNNIITGKQWKRSDISRQKQDKRNIANQHQTKFTSHHTDENMKNNPKSINFRNLKETVQVQPMKKETGHQIKNPVSYNMKPSNQYYPKAMGQRQTHDCQAIAINVNIQNMLPPKQTDNSQILPLSDRSLIGEEKKNRKPTATAINKFDDFQCAEQLTYKRTQLQKKSKIPDKTVQKVPLIDRKHLKTEVHVKPKEKVLDFKQTIKKFQTQMQAINSVSQAETVSYLDIRQQAYLIHPHYIQKCQKNFTWKMRATLMEWMMHVSYQFSMKRQTFYIAVNLVDLYLSKQFHLHKSDFQLAGAAAMFIASKLEQFQPKSSEQFAKATNTYSATEVKQMQRKICKALKYTLNPPTLYTWANRFMLQWDTYLELNPYSQRHPFFASHMPKYFKKWDDDSYKQFRTMMQLLDFAALDIQTVQYQPKIIVCAFMYLVLGKQMGDFKLKQIIHAFPRSSTYMLDEQNLFNDLFLNFVQASFNLGLHDLLPAVQYCATYFILPFNYDDPITQNHADDENNMEFEDFCSCQTYNPNMKMAINKRFRGII